MPARVLVRRDSGLLRNKKIHRFFNRGIFSHYSKNIRLNFARIWGIIDIDSKEACELSDIVVSDHLSGNYGLIGSFPTFLTQ